MEGRQSRWVQRFSNYRDVLRMMSEVIPVYDQLSELEKDGLVQRFEFTFDLAWKVMQDYLANAGYNDIKGPRNCIRQMALDGFIDSFIWEDILLARNELSHIYSEDRSRTFLDRIVNDFYPVFISFEQKMQSK